MMVVDDQSVIFTFFVARGNPPKLDYDGSQLSMLLGSIKDI